MKVFCGLVIGVTLILALVGILGDDWGMVLWGLVAIALACCLGALLNLAIFPPIFRVLARLTRKRE